MSLAASQAARAAAMSRARSCVSQVKPSPMARQVTRSRKPLEHLRSPVSHDALDELHDADAHAVAEAAHHHAEGGGRFALAVAGMDDEEAALLRLAREHRSRAALRFAIFSAWRALSSASLSAVGHGAAASSRDAVALAAVHRPRSIASRSARLYLAERGGIVLLEELRAPRRRRDRRRRPRRNGDRLTTRAVAAKAKR